MTVFSKCKHAVPSYTNAKPRNMCLIFVWTANIFPHQGRRPPCWLQLIAAVGNCRSHWAYCYSYPTHSFFCLWCLKIPAEVDQHHGLLTRYVKLWAAHAPGMPEMFSPPPMVSDPDMHRGTCVTHVPWCMTGSLTSGFLWSRWRWKPSRHSRHMRNPQFYLSGKRPMAVDALAHCVVRSSPTMISTMLGMPLHVSNSVDS